MPALQGSPELVSHLNGLVADAVVFHYKLHHYHWFVSGSRFDELHAKFEVLYTNAATDLDELAERVLSVGAQPIGSLADCLNASGLVEEAGSPDASQMLRNVIADLKVCHARISATIVQAEGENDRGTVNLLDAMSDRIEKDLWMLSASLD